MNKSMLASRQYFITVCSAVMLIFACALARKLLLPAHPEWQTVIFLAPIAPVLLVAAAIWRLVTRMDEYRKRNFLNAVAVGAFAVAVTATIYPFLRRADLIGVVPYGMAWPVLAAGWMVVGYRTMWVDSTSTIGVPHVLKHMAANLSVVAALTLGYWLIAAMTGWEHGTAALASVAGIGALIVCGYASFIKRNPLA